MTTNKTPLTMAWAAVLTLGAVACGSTPAPTDGGDAAAAVEVTRLADAYVAAYLDRFPENAVFAGVSSAASDHLFDNSMSALAAWQAREDAWLNELAKIDAASLRGRPEWVTHGFLREALESSQALRVCRAEYWPVSQLEGWQLTLSGLAGMQPVATNEQRQRLLTQWRQWPRYLTTEMENLAAGLKAGYSTPKPSVERVVSQLDGLLATPAEQSVLDSPAQRAKDDAFASEWRSLVGETLLPAIQRYRDYLQQQYLPRARGDLSVLAHPDGEACYAASLRRFTGLTTSGAEIFAAGERAVSDYTLQAKQLARSLYATDDLSQLRERMAADANNHFETREQVLAYSQAALDRAKQVVPAQFGPLPAAEVRIEPMPAFEEQGGVPHYIPPAEDGSRPGVFAISLYAPEQQSKASLESTAFHEAIPGHHLQSAAAQAAGKAHPITQLLWNSGYGEGWAVYAERQAAELGLFSSDLARLGSLIQTPTGMVADPGLHLRRWSRQQTIDYLLAQRSDYSPQYAAAQTDRMSVMPGQLTTYFVGALEIQALRRQAEQALGKRFDVREFHRRVRDSGAITLPMLREKIDAWIASVNAKQQRPFTFFPRPAKPSVEPLGQRSVHSIAARSASSCHVRPFRHTKLITHL